MVKWTPLYQILKVKVTFASVLPIFVNFCFSDKASEGSYEHPSSIFLFFYFDKKVYSAGSYKAKNWQATISF